MGKEKLSEDRYRVYYLEQGKGSQNVTWNGWTGGPGDMQLVHLDTGIWILSYLNPLSGGWVTTVGKAEEKPAK